MHTALTQRPDREAVAIIWVRDNEGVNSRNVGKPGHGFEEKRYLGDELDKN